MIMMLAPLKDVPVQAAKPPKAPSETAPPADDAPSEQAASS